jgi:hypothetical protein
MFVKSVDRIHRGVNVGTAPAKLLATVVGIRGKPFTAPAPKQK